MRNKINQIKELIGTIQQNKHRMNFTAKENMEEIHYDMGKMFPDLKNEDGTIKPIYQNILISQFFLS